MSFWIEIFASKKQISLGLGSSAWLNFVVLRRFAEWCCKRCIIDRLQVDSKKFRRLQSGT